MFSQKRHNGQNRKYGSCPSRALVLHGNSLFGVSVISILMPIRSRSWLQVDTPSTPRQLQTVPAFKGSYLLTLDTFITTSHQVFGST